MGKDFLGRLCWNVLHICLIWGYLYSSPFSVFPLRIVDPGWYAVISEETNLDSYLIIQ